MVQALEKHCYLFNLGQIPGEESVFVTSKPKVSHAQTNCGHKFEKLLLRAGLMNLCL